MSKIRPTDISLETAADGSVLLIDGGKPKWMPFTGGGGGSGAPATSAPTIVQSAFGAKTGTGGVTVTLPAAPIPGNILLVIWNGAGGNIPVPPSGYSIIGFNGNVDSLIASTSEPRGFGSLYQGAFAAIRRVVSGDTASLTFATGSDRNNVALIEITDADCFDFRIGAVQASGANFVGVRQRSIQSQTLGLAIIEHDGTAAPTVTASGYTALAGTAWQPGGGANHVAQLYSVAPDAGDAIGSFSANPTYPAIWWIEIAKLEDGATIPGGGGGDASYPDFTNNAGKLLAVNSGETGVEWVASAPSELRTSTIGPRKFWRLAIADVQSDKTYASIANLEFRTVAGTPQLATGGRAISIGDYNNATDLRTANAFDGDPSTRWAAYGFPTPAFSFPLGERWIGYEFASPIKVTEVMIQAPANVVAETPTLFSIQFSDDGVEWTTAAHFRESAWSAGESRLFAIPSYYSGLGGSGATALADLTDVDLSTPPTNGQTLIWDAATSKFIPGSAGSDGGGVGVPGGGGSSGAATGSSWVVVANGTGSSQTIQLPIGGVTNTSLLVFVNGIRWGSTEYAVNDDELVITTRLNDNIAAFFAGSTTNYAYGGARVTMNATSNLSTINTWTPIAWTTEQRDTDTFWISSAPTRLTIPAGVTKVRVSAGIQVDASDAVENNGLTFFKNGSSAFAGNVNFNFGSSGLTNPGATGSTDVIDVVAGDYFTFNYYASGTFSIAATSWFAIEVIERNSAATGVSLPLKSILDVSAAAPANGDSLVWNSTTQRWTAQPASNTATGLNAPFKGAMAMMTANRSTTGSANVVWDGTDYDTDGFWSAAAPSRLTIPAGKGIKKVRITAALTPSDSSLSSDHFIAFAKNGSRAFRGSSYTGGQVGNAGAGLSTSSPVIAVTAGDYFEVYYSSSDTARLWGADYCHFSIEVVEVQV